MHSEVLTFLEDLKTRYPLSFAGRILECGSLSINGSPRLLFNATEYVGIDHVKGPGVDEIGLAHEYKGRPDGYFDTVISTEMLEHDPHWVHSIRRMAALVKSGGSLIITCAGPGRPEHHVETAPGGQNHYQNVSLRDLLGFMLGAARFRYIIAEDDSRTQDTRFFGRVKY